MTPRTSIEAGGRTVDTPSISPVRRAARSR
jgi:hypothetical protein